MLKSNLLIGSILLMSSAAFAVADTTDEVKCSATDRSGIHFSEKDGSNIDSGMEFLKPKTWVHLEKSNMIIYVISSKMEFVDNRNEKTPANTGITRTKATATVNIAVTDPKTRLTNFLLNVKLSCAGAETAVYSPNLSDEELDNGN